MPRKRGDTDLATLFASGATCFRCGRTADSWAQMEAEQWIFTVWEEPDGSLPEGPIPECPECGKGWEGLFR